MPPLFILSLELLAVLDYTSGHFHVSFRDNYVKLLECHVSIHYIVLSHLNQIISSIIIYLNKIVILHHGMQSFHNNRLLHACLLHARLLHDCDVTHPFCNLNITTRACKLTLCRMVRNELVLKTFDNYQ